MNEFIAQACISLRPSAGVSVDDQGIHWHNIDHNNIPSDEDIKVEANRLKLLNDNTAYQRQRAAEYPDFKEYLDGIVKGDQAQIDSYISACLAVKQKYPKEAS